MDAEKRYRETEAALDDAESERRAEEATQVPEGQDPMEEFAKQQAMKKAKWTYLTKMFYDPEGAQ